MSLLSPMEKMEVFISLQAGKTTSFDEDLQIYGNTGIGIKTLRMKAGEVVVGRIHEIWCVNMLVSGSMLVTDNPEASFTEIEAPFVFESSPGSQKFGMCQTDCVFINIITTLPDETLDALSKRMAKKSRIEETIITKELLCQ